MTKVDLMELADLVRPKDIANAIIKQNPHITGKVPLDEIAYETGIKDIQYKSLDKIEGALVANDEKSEGIIIVNNKSRPQRQRFTLGHELGHFLIHRHGSKMNCSLNDLMTKEGKANDSNQTIEAEANTFSANLLMPELLFKQSSMFKKKVPSIPSIIDLSYLFDVSVQACANRYVDLFPEPLAIVCSHRGIINYGYSSPDHPLWLKAKKGTKVPDKTVTSGMDFNVEKSENMDETHADCWFDARKYSHLPEYVFEQSYVQENGYAITLLWLEEELSDE